MRTRRFAVTVTEARALAALLLATADKLEAHPNVLPGAYINIRQPLSEDIDDRIAIRVGIPTFSEKVDN